MSAHNPSNKFFLFSPLLNTNFEIYTLLTKSTKPMTKFRCKLNIAAMINFRLYFQAIATELYRNVLLAMLVVFLVTFLIIANPLTSLLVFFCVAFTVVSTASNFSKIFTTLVILAASFAACIIIITTT